MAPGSTGAPYATMLAPVSRMAPGVRSSGSTLIPPVHRIMSTPLSRNSRAAAVMAARSSPGRQCSVTWMPYRASLSTMAGVKASWIRPPATSPPVVIRPQVFSFQGCRERMGLSPARRSATSSLYSSMTRGMMRVPANLSPFRTLVLVWRVAMIISSSSLMAFSRGTST